MAHGHLHQVLQDCNLLEYEPLLLEEGADDVSQLKELDEEEFRQLCLMIGMASKPFHIKRFQKALARPSSQIYSTKLMSAGTAAPAKVPQVQPPPVAGSPLPTSILAPPHRATRPVSMAPPLIPQAKQVHPPGGSSSCSSTSTLYNKPSADNYYQQHQITKPQVQKPNIPPTLPSSSITTIPHSLSSKDFPEMTSSSTSSSISYHHTISDRATSPDRAHPTTKHPFLPPYLHPDSDGKDLSCLVDEQTPIQAELGPCPFKPSDWDERRTELVNRYSAIYGQGGGSKRKFKELLLHEESINMAAFQLCLRDPTLLVRRDELLILSRKAIKDGGYMYQHGLAKAKVSAAGTTSIPDPNLLTATSTPTNSTLQTEILSLDDGGSSSSSSTYLTTRSLLPAPRNMSREKKLKRIEELEFLIAKNKMRQSIKLASLEKARQTNDFSMSHHLQAEIESLGTTLATLQDEYSNMKYRLRRSDRYFEKKKKMEDASEEEMSRSLHLSSSSAPVDLMLEVVPKRHHTDHTPPGNYYAPLSGEEMMEETRVEEDFDIPESSSAAMDDMYSRETNSSSVTNTTVTYSRSLLQPKLASSSMAPDLPSSSSSSFSHTSTNKSSSSSSSLYSSSTSHSDTVSTSRPLIEGNTVNNSMKVEDGGSPPTSTNSSSNRQVKIGVKRKEKQTTTAAEEKEEEELPATQLLESINKLATQAAENLRSLPHF